MFTQAVECHQRGDLPQAEYLYRQILAADPAHADAHHLLGVLALQTGRLHEAVVCIRRALELDPGSADYHANLGLALQNTAQLDQGAVSYRQALTIDPEHLPALVNLGNTLALQGQHEEASLRFRAALRLRPDLAEAHCGLGVAAAALGDVDDGAAHLREALRLRPRYVEAHCNLANILVPRGQLDAARLHYQQALLIHPDCAEAHCGLATVHLRRGEFADAEARGYQALALKPGFAEAHNNLGNVFFAQGKLDQALQHYRQAVALRPKDALAQANLVSCLNIDPAVDPDTLFAEHRRWGQLQQHAIQPRTHSNDRHPERRLRIGYVSPDLCQHPVASFLEPVLAHHDPGQVEVFCYAEVAQPDAVTARLQSLVPGWRWTCDLRDVQLADAIQQDRIDILVDLAGHTDKTRLSLFAHKPAPIQVTWLGYLNTTGLMTIDYRLTDDVLDPPGEPIRNTEELFHLPVCMCCWRAPADAPAVTALPALRRGHLTFGSLNRLVKMNARVFDLWSHLLRAMPTAGLLMIHRSLTAAAQHDVRRQFAERGVTGPRLDLRQGSNAPGYLGVYSEIDVSLDTSPWTGSATTCESLWMGVPVLALSGDRPLSRNSASLLTRVGLTDWIVKTPEQYAAQAAEMTSDLDRLARLRGELRDRMTATLCDSEGFTRELERAFRAMWRRWCGGQAAKLNNEAKDVHPQIAQINAD